MSNVAASNFTSLYSANASPVVPAMPYGDANVVTLLNAGTVAGNTVGNITASGEISATGNIVTDGFFVGNFAGNISGNIVVPGLNTQVLFNNNGNAGASAGFVFDSATNAAVVTGNITANYFVGNGSQLTGLPASYGNANVAAYLPTYTGNLAGGNAAITGAVTAATVSTTGNITANYFVGNGSLLTGISGSGNYSNANVAAYLPTYTGALTALTGNVTTTANISGAFVLGNGSQLTGLPATYGNANVAAYLPTYGGNLSPGNITSTGNITGNLVSNSVYASQSAGFIVNGPAGPNTGNLVAGNISATDRITATGNIVSAGNVSGGNLLTGGNIVMNGTPGSFGFITAPSNIRGANLQSNTNITAGGAISATGNITGNFFVGNGSLLTGVVAVGDYSNANVAAYLPTYTGNLAAGNANITNNITAGGITTTGVSGDISGVNTLTASNVIATTVTAGNITANSAVNSATVSASGNITGNYFVGNGSLLTGVSTSYGNANVAAYLPTYTGNLSPGNVNATQIVAATNGQFSSSLNVGGGNLGAPGTVIITSGGITAGTGNIQTAGNIVFASTANGQSIIGLNNMEASGEIRATTLYAAGNIEAPGSWVKTENLNLTGNIFMTGNVPGRTVNFGFANLTGIQNFQANSLSSFNDITASGNVIAREFVTANSCIMDDNFWTDGYIRVVPFGTAAAGAADSQVEITPGLVAIGRQARSAAGNSTINFHTGTANVDYDTRILASGGSSNSGQGIITISAANTVATGNVTANYFVGNGSLLTGITATGDYGNANVAAYLPTYTGNLVSLTGNVTTTANISGNFFVGNGSLLTGIAAGGTPGGSNTQIQFNTDGAFAGDAAFTFNSATDTLQIGNISVGTNRVQNSTAFVPATSGMAPGQIIVGNGYLGNVSVNEDAFNRARNARVAVWGSHEQGNSSVRTSGQIVQESVILTANVTNSNSRMFASQNLLQIGGGASNFSFTPGSSSAASASFNTIQIGQSGNLAVGNTSVNTALGVSSQVFVNAGSNLTTAIGYRAESEGNVANFVAFSSITNNVSGAAVPASYTVLGHTSTVQGSLFRQAPEYFFLRNEDNAAQVRLGSLQRYHEFNYTSGNTSGNITINKNNAQVQTIVPTGNITIDGYSNVVTSASDSVNTDQQVDTLTLIIAQGATPYTVTMPTGATYKYAGGGNTVGATANAVTMISVTAVNIGGTTNYLTTISPEFV